MILCDTNILIEFYKNNPQITEELRRIGPNIWAGTSPKVAKYDERLMSQRC